MREYRRRPVPGVHVRRAPQVYTPEEEMNNLQQAIDNSPDQKKAFFSSLLRQSGGQDLPPPPVLQPLVPHNDANIEPRTSQCMKRRAPGDDVARICDAMQESDSIPREYPSIPLTVRTGSIPEEIIAVKSTT